MTISTSSSPRTDKRAAKVEKLRRQARSSLTTYKKVMYKRYQHARHLEALDQALEQVTRYVETGGKEGIGRLIIEMPPRHGKTKTTSQLYPTWHLGRNPNHRIMLVSYGAGLAFKNSRAARNFIKAPRYQAIFGHQLARDSAAVDSWSFEEDSGENQGGADALGIRGGATGKGAHVLIIDDPIQNRMEAESKDQREKIWEAYQDDLESRLEPGGAIILMATRWHIDDPTGRALKQGGWARLRLPAIAEKNDPIGRQPGEALWPERYPIEVLQKIRASRSNYSWLSLYQQSPIDKGGGIFKSDLITKYRLPAPPPHVRLVRVVIAIDPSVSSKKTSDEVGMVAGFLGSDGHAYITHDVSDRLTPLGWAKRAVGLYYELKADRIVAEKNNGGELVEINVRTVDPKVSYKPVWASRGKETRAEPVASLYELGSVHHVGSHPDLEEEMVTWVQRMPSPNRMDALVWLVTDLLLGEKSGEMPEQPQQSSKFANQADVFDGMSEGSGRWKKF